MGHWQVSLSWNGTSASSFDAYGNKSRIVTTAGTMYMDSLLSKGSYVYRVCESGTSTCSNQVTVIV